MPIRVRPLGSLELNVQVPLYFRCPISLDLMQDPVILSTGQTYDRSSIEKWVSSGNTTCPVTMQKLEDFTLIPNHTLRRLIQEWCVANRSRGVERIPTPKQPADPHRLRSLLAEASFTGAESVPARAFAIRALRNMVRDSEKNRSLMVEAGAVPILIAAFFSDVPDNGPEICESTGKIAAGEVAEEALGVLVLLPLTDGERLMVVQQQQRLAFVSAVVRWGSLEARANAGLLIELLCSSKDRPELRVVLGMADGLVDGLVELTRSKGSPGHTRAARAAVRALVALCQKRQGRERALDAGAVAALIDRLRIEPVPQKGGGGGACEAVERTVEGVELLCLSERGRAEVSERAEAAVPALLCVILKVSERTTEAAVATLLAVCSGSEFAQRVAAQAGVMKELLLLIQSDCTPRAKAKAMSLLKLLRSVAWLSAACMAEYGRSDVVPF